MWLELHGGYFGGRVNQDNRIRAEVVDELRWMPGFGLAHIQVAVADGVIKLAGSVTDCKHRFLAECAARRVSGAARVANSIQVARPRSNSAA